MKEFALSSLVKKIAKCTEYCIRLKSAINFKIEKKMDSQELDIEIDSHFIRNIKIFTFSFLVSDRLRMK